MRIHRRSISIPVSPSYVLHVQDIDLQNENYSQPLEEPVGARFEANAGLRRLFHSPRAHHIDISSMAFDRFAFFSRKAQTTAEYRFLEQLLKQPMQISNTELSHVLRLQDVFVENNLVSMTNTHRAHRFYVRSWVFTPAQLLLVVQLLREKGFGSTRLDEWEFQCCIATFGALTVRYIGMIKGRRDFIQRSQLDVSGKSPNSLFGAFRDTLTEIFPYIHDRMEIHEFPDLVLAILGPHGGVGSQLVADDTERLLIQLFGERSLLNVQSGGQYIVYLPKVTDETVFRSQLQSFPESDWCNVSENFRAIEKHARFHGELYHFHDTYFEAMKTESRPYQYKGHTILVFIGEQLSQRHLRAGHTFFQGSASVSVFIRQLTTRLHNIEREKSYLRCKVDNVRKTYTFINTLPLPSFSDEQWALSALKSYIRCVNPIIAVTYGHRAHGAIASQFQKLGIQKHEPSSPARRVVRISTYPDENIGSHGMIHISLSHPGKYQYGRRDSGDLRNFYLQTQIVYLVAHLVMEVIDQRTDTQWWLSRYNLLTEVLRRVRETLKCLSTFCLSTSDDGTSVSSTGRSLLKRKSEALVKDFTCPIFGYDTFNHIISLGRAHGGRDSPERIAQLQKLWVENIPELHLVIPHKQDMYGRWTEEFSTLAEGQLFFLKVLNSIPQSDYLKALSRVCNSTEATELRSGLWVPRQEIRAYRAELSPRVKTKGLQGFPVEIKSSGELKIKWLTSTGAKRTLSIESPRCALPKNGFESRAVSFTEHGIDIVDASGRALRQFELWEKEPPLATIPRWKAVRSELGHGIPANRIAGVPRMRNGVGLVPSNSEIENPRQNKPPRVYDANFLLFNFLNERFPDGGVFRTISKAKDKSSTEDLHEFVRFCQRPENANHPYSAKWLELLDRPHPLIAILAPNIRVYRKCETRKTYPYLSHSGQHFTETIFHLGPLGEL
ncbi:hypothetical protein BJY00DRAFT_299170 [Aspergillus carlsbadensis]|nr:hypothetical protein BJY00DRAFT_299170 [Aspergillus carlsbadensis]